MTTKEVVERRSTTEIARLNQSPVSSFGFAKLEVDMTMAELIDAIIDSEEISFAKDDDAETLILQRLAAAETREELFGDRQATGWAELVGVPVQVRGFRLLPSSIMDSVGAKTFAVVDAFRLDTSENVILTSSSKGVLVQLLRGVCTGDVPGVFKLALVGQEVKGRNQPQRLVALDDNGLASALADESNPLDETEADAA